MTKNQLWLAAGVLAVALVVCLLLPSRPPGHRAEATPPPTASAANTARSASVVGQVPAVATNAGTVNAGGQPASAHDAAPSSAIPASATGASIKPGGTQGPALLAEVSTAQATMIDLDLTRRAIRDYHTLMGENPVGTNAEIMKSLMGGNPRQATLGPGEGQRLNAKGELIDQWGTPYFFHQLSGTQMEIHSAGPDKVMGTEDDIILK